MAELAGRGGHLRDGAWVPEVPEHPGEALGGSDEGFERPAERFVFAAPDLEARVDAPDRVVRVSGEYDDAATRSGRVLAAGEGQVLVEWFPVVDADGGGL